MAISPGGDNLYSAAANPGNAVAVFSRDGTTGALTQLAGTAGCVSETGSGGACADGVSLDAARGVVVSSDGKNVYAGAVVSDSVAAFARSAATGALTQLSGQAACISETGSGGTCTDGKGLDGVISLSISPLGDHLYAPSTGTNAVAALARDATTGALTQLPGLDGCISHAGSGGACEDGRNLVSAWDVAFSPNGRFAYVASLSGGISAFARATGPAPTCTSVKKAVARDTATQVTLSCTPAADGDPMTRDLRSLPANGTLTAFDAAAGTVTYTPKAGFSGTDSFTFFAVDHDGESTLETATLEVAGAGGTQTPTPTRPRSRPTTTRDPGHYTPTDAGADDPTVDHGARGDDHTAPARGAQSAAVHAQVREPPTLPRPVAPPAQQQDRPRDDPHRPPPHDEPARDQDHRTGRPAWTSEGPLRRADRADAGRRAQDQRDAPLPDLHAQAPLLTRVPGGVEGGFRAEGTLSCYLPSVGLQRNRVQASRAQCEGGAGRLVAGASGVPGVTRQRYSRGARRATTVDPRYCSVCGT